VGVLGRVGAARRIISAWGGCLLSGASRWAVHGSRCSQVLAVRDLPSLLCGESTPPRPALLPLAQGSLGAAAARLRPCVASFFQMVRREGTHRIVDTRRDGLLEQLLLR
jgi:hypothetical protein